MTIVLMIWTHTYESLSTGFEPSLSAINTYVRGSIAGAAAFMFCMGTGLAYTTHNSSGESFQRGIKIITTGFILKLFQEIVPALLSSLIFNLPDNLVYLVYGLSVDILQFAGLSFLFIGCLKKLKVEKTGILLISIALSILGTLLEGISTGCYPVDQILGFIWGTPTDSYFPFFNWFIFVAAGQWFADKYQFLQGKKRFHAISLLVGTLLCAAYIYVSFNVEQNIFKGLTSKIFLGHRPVFDAIVCLPINVGLISLFYFIGLVIPKKLVPAIIHPSKHINQYYCISWVLIQPIYYLCPGFERLSSDSQVILFWICILTATVLAVTIYSKYLKERMESFFGKHRIFWSALVWGLCIASFILAVCLFDEYPNLMNNYEI
ncbi:MAG: heparan-alpha-glucosaminide N-acetyltransferase domain-containing protein [Bacteroidales bacterium]|nr:heparan-alpha-glucosaminide N-acetyltransferase domain-containing protein [Bacteroidales bacterium]